MSLHLPKSHIVGYHMSRLILPEVYTPNICILICLTVSRTFRDLIMFLSLII